MEVKVVYTGILRHYLKAGEESFEIPDGSTVGELMSEVGKARGGLLPAGAWDPETGSFDRIILAVRRGGGVREASEVLQPGEEILLISRLAGG
jgi:molybdopterin converting factor small subunit